MNKAAALSKAKTEDRFDRQEGQRSKRGYAYTSEFAAVINADGMAIKLADHIRTDERNLRRYGLL